MEKRNCTADRFALMVDGQALGFVKSFSGGAIKGQVATRRIGPDNVIKKHISAIHYEEITIEVGMDMSHTFYEWIRQSLDKPHHTRSGEIVSVDFDYNALRAIEFYDAYISEVTVPNLDGSSKDPAYFTIKIDPEQLRHTKRDGEKLSAKMGTKTKKWLPANFRFELGSLPCQGISKIDAFTLKQCIAEDSVGEFHEPTKHPAKLEVPNLTIYLSAADAEAWEDWFRSFVIDGKRADSDELDGRITMLGPDHSEVLGQIELHHCGIISLQPTDCGAEKGKTDYIKVEIYVEEIKFNMNVTDA